MLQQALQKIQAEINSDPKNNYARVVGSYLMNHIRDNPEDAAKIMAEGKTIAGSLGAMRSEASKSKTGNVGVLTPDQGYEIVLKYYGIEIVKEAEQPAAVSFNVSLDDLLEE